MYAAPNKPMVATATTQLDRYSPDSGRRHIGHPFGRERSRIVASRQRMRRLARTLVSGPRAPLRVSLAIRDRVRVFALVVAFVNGSVLPGCRSPECGATRGDELERHGQRTLRAANEGHGDQTLRELGIALGLSPHDPTVETTDYADLGLPFVEWGRHSLVGRGRGVPGPTVRARPPDISGLLPSEAIRRVVLRNLGQVNRCHELGVANDATAAGRVTIRFAVSDTGDVVASRVTGRTYPIASVAACIAEAARRWRFPASGGRGMTIVNYPFDLLLNV